MSLRAAFDYEVRDGDFSHAGEASRDVKRQLVKLRIPAEAIRRAAVCMYEGEINMVIHALGGKAEVEVLPERITIVLKDRGPGIPDIEQAMQEGWSTASENARNLGFGAGMGLSNMKKYSDDMRIDTVIGEGTTVTMVVNTIK